MGETDYFYSQPAHGLTARPWSGAVRCSESSCTQAHSGILRSGRHRLTASRYRPWTGCYCFYYLLLCFYWPRRAQGW